MNIIPETNGSVLLTLRQRDNGEFYAEGVPIIAWACEAADRGNAFSSKALPITAGWNMGVDEMVVLFADGSVHDIGGDELFDSALEWVKLTAPKPSVD